MNRQQLKFYLQKIYTFFFQKKNEQPIWCKSKIVIRLNAAIRNNPFFSITANSFIIDWGDGNINTESAHLYIDKQEYTITITAINIISLCIKQCGIKAIQFYNCKTLFVLYCSFNQLETLDISACPNLETLECSDNLLRELTITGTPDYLSRIFCDGNKLKTISCKNLPALEILICKENQLNKLYISNCRNLWRLDCRKNPISTDQIFNSLPKKKTYYIQRIVTFDMTDENGKIGQQFKKKGWYYYRPEPTK